jgi:hypothetical protein
MLKTHATFDYKNAFWFSLSEGINKKLRLQDKEIATITSVEGMLRVLALYYLGLLPLFPVHDKVFGITLEEVNDRQNQDFTCIININSFVLLIYYCILQYYDSFSQVALLHYITFPLMLPSLQPDS